MLATRYFLTVVASVVEYDSCMTKAVRKYLVANKNYHLYTAGNAQ